MSHSISGDTDLAMLPPRYFVSSVSVSSIGQVSKKEIALPTDPEWANPIDNQMPMKPVLPPKRRAHKALFFRCTRAALIST